MPVELNVNGTLHVVEVEPRMTLLDCLRDRLSLTGAHAGCEHGVCGACTVLLDDVAVRSCLMFAVQAVGRAVRTVEGLEDEDGGMHPLQRSFHERHALQCGFCTAGFLMALEPFVRDRPGASDEEIREALAGNLCRCTGYEGIVEAVRDVARQDP
jgi:carbon-monoxide dehydrogenase small subunit